MIGRRGFFKAIGAVLLAPYVAPLVTPVVKNYGVIELIAPLETIDVTQAFGVDFEWTDIEADLALERGEAQRIAKSWADAWDRNYTQPFKVGDTVRVVYPRRLTI